MKTTINSDEAFDIWNKYLSTPYLKSHTLESKAIMEKLAKSFNADPIFWGITGLLHDLDMDVIAGDYKLHGYKSVEILRFEGFEIPELFDAIIAHCEGVPNSDARRIATFHFILSAAENITGLITAYVLMKPDKKIAGTSVQSIKKRLKQKSFAAGVNRDFIYDIQDKAGLDLDVFLQISIDAMCGIADEIGM